MKRMQKRQAGFTMLEIGIVMIILVSLMVAFSSSLWDKQKASDVGLIRLWFTKNVPEAIATCRLKHGNNLQNAPTGGTAMHDALVDCGLEDETIYGGTWTAADVADSSAGVPMIEFSYPIAPMQDYAVEGQRLADSITEEGGLVIESTAFTTPNQIIQVRVR